MPNRLGPAPPGPGLYGGTMHLSQCDTGGMLAFLRQNPAKAAAWASVQGIPVQAVPRYLAGLTSVRTRRPVAVTTYTYANDRPVPVPMVLVPGTAILVDDVGVPRSLCYCGNPVTADVAISAFVDRCEKGVFTGWRAGQVDFPKQVQVELGMSAAYQAAVDIRANPPPPAQVIGGPAPGAQPVQVKCVISARLVPPTDKSLDVSKQDWVTNEFTPSGVVTWQWQLTGQHSGDHPLSLELQPTVVSNGTGLALPTDNSPYISSYLTTVHVRAGALSRFGEWWDANWKVLVGVLAAIGAAILALLRWLGDLREAARKLRTKSTSP